MMLESVIRFVADNIGNMLSTKRIADIMTADGRKIDQKQWKNTSHRCVKPFCVRIQKIQRERKTTIENPWQILPRGCWAKENVAGRTIIRRWAIVGKRGVSRTAAPTEKCVHWKNRQLRG